MEDNNLGTEKKHNKPIIRRPPAGAARRRKIPMQYRGKICSIEQAYKIVSKRRQYLLEVLDGDRNDLVEELIQALFTLELAFATDKDREKRVMLYIQEENHGN